MALVSTDCVVFGPALCYPILFDKDTSHLTSWNVARVAAINVANTSSHTEIQDTYLNRGSERSVQALQLNAPARVEDTEKTELHHAPQQHRQIVKGPISSSDGGGSTRASRSGKGMNGKDVQQPSRGDSSKDGPAKQTEKSNKHSSGKAPSSKATPEVSLMSNLVHDIVTKDTHQKVRSVTQVLASFEGGLAVDAIDTAVDAGVIEAVVPLLNDDDFSVSQLSAFVLAGLSGSGARHRTRLVEAGAVPQLAKLLRSSDRMRQEAAALVLQGVSHGKHILDVVNAGAAKPLVAMLKQTSHPLSIRAAGVLFNMVNDEEEKSCARKARQTIIKAGGIEASIRIVQDGATRDDLWLSWGISVLGSLIVDGLDSAIVQRVLNVLPRVVQLLQAQTSEAVVKERAARFLSELAQNASRHVKKSIIEAGAIEPLLKFAESSKSGSKVWALSALQMLQNLSGTHSTTIRKLLHSSLTAKFHEREA